MATVRGGQRLLAPIDDGLDVTSIDLLGREQRETIVVMLDVVPGEELIAPAARMREIAETPGIIWLVLQRVEVRFGKRIVVRDAAC